MDEIKKMLRSILVSSPLTISVAKLNSDYREVVGCNIPFRELGHENLLSFLRSIPDILRIEGNSLHSEVTLIVSEKTAHVNDMVLKQKVKKRRPGPILGNSRGRFPSRFNQPRMITRYNNTYTPPPQRIENFTSQNHHYQNSRIYNNSSYNQKNISSPIRNTKFPNNITQSNISLNVDLKLKEAGEIKPKTENAAMKKEDTHYLRRPHYMSENSPQTPTDVSRIPSLFDIDTSNSAMIKNELLKKDTNDFMRQLLLEKDTLSVSSQIHLHKDSLQNIDSIKESPFSENIEEPKYISNTTVPKNVQDNLKELISNFSNGIWCSQLPTEYKKFFGKELDYQEFGYRCLINMCMDLEDIFHCSKESSCDFKLYDVMQPVPADRILQDRDVKNILDLSASRSPAVPKLDWNSYMPLIPEDAIPLGKEIPRDFIPSTTKVGDFLNVVVAEIYDPSKFWLYKDDGNLDSLMDEMQIFYQQNDKRYSVPEYLLEFGLYCVVVTLKEFHRAVIVNVPPGENYIKVFFIDYGSLGTAQKKEVWFLTKQFSELPAQAIRARLADIFPPVENTTWSRKASTEFRKLASMKHVEAKIAKIVPNKNIIEVYLENLKASPGRYINNILAEEGHALVTSKTRRKSVEDPNCVPKVKFIHLFPTFEEIEYWLVPSVEDMINLYDLDIPADFFFPHYFTRPIDKDLIDKIERKSKKQLERKEKLVRYIDQKKLYSMHDLEEMNKAAYGDTYESFREELREIEEKIEINLGVAYENDEADGCDYENLLNKLRRKNISKCGPAQSTDREDGEDIFDQFFGLNIREEIKKTGAMRKKEILEMGKYPNRIGNSKNACELEKYLSEEEEEEDISSREPSPISSKLIDLDSVFSTPLKTSNTSKNVSSEFSFSQSDFTSYRKKYRSSIMSNSSSVDMQLSSILDTPIELGMPNVSNRKCASPSSDLIQLDVVLDNPILIPQVIGGMNHNEIPSAPSSSLGFFENLCDTDDDGGSEDRLNPEAPDFVVKGTNTTEPVETAAKAVQTNEYSSVSFASNGTRTCLGNENVNCNTPENPYIRSNSSSSSNAYESCTSNVSVEPIVSSSSEIKSNPCVSNVSSAPHTSCGSSSEPSVSSSSNVPDTSCALTSSSSELTVSVVSTVETNTCSGGTQVNEVTSVSFPPGFGPVPRYREPQRRGNYTLYQPWSTADCYGNNLGMGYSGNLNGMHIPGVASVQQQMFAQVASMFQCPPIVVFNYNGMPIMPVNERFLQQNFPNDPNQIHK